MTINKTLSTSEFNLACFLLSKKDCELVSLDRTNPRRIKFVFADVPQETIDSFWRNEEVGVADFINAQRDLKQRIFADVF